MSDTNGNGETQAAEKPSKKILSMATLSPAPGSHHRRKRIGRGIGSGHGKTSTRGHKGDKARGTTKPGFEGGQSPLHRRLPQKRGFTPVNKEVYALVNLSALERFDDGAEITPEFILANHVVRDLRDGLKILGDGELTKKLTVRAHYFSKSARARIEALGGTAEALPTKKGLRAAWDRELRKKKGQGSRR